MNTKALRQKILDLAIHGKLVPPACRQAGKSLENIPAEKEGQWFVYVIECVDGSFYKGFTTDLIKRYKQDCAGIGAEWTKNHKPKQLFYWEIHYSEKSAIEREKYLESGCGREWFKNEVVDKPENWESATVLLEKIRAEKAEKIKKGLPAGRRGELKADKKDSFIFVGSDKRHYEQFADGTVKDIEDEIPFEVPEGWAWCRLHSISVLLNGDRGENYPSKNDYVKQGIPFINAGCLDNGFIDFSLANYITEEKYNSLRAGKIQEGDILYCLRGSLGKTGIVINNSRGAISSSLCIFRLSKVIQPEFFLHVLNSSIILNQQNLVDNGTAQPNLSAKDVSNYFIPLPSISEQQIIISAIEKLFEQIDTLEENKADLQNIIKQTKSKILDLAIHGKLVPQDPNDEPAEELLKRIATSDNRPYEKVDEEVDYEIPKNWRFCKIKDVCSVIMGQTPEGEAVSDDKNGMEFHQGKICFGEKYLEESSSFTKHITKIAPKDSVLLCVRPPVGIVNITEREICIGRGLCAVIPKYEINSDFWFYWLQSLQSDFEQKATGTTFRAISVDVIKNQFVAIPPHEEQNRIVNKINELYEQLDKIVLNLV